MKLNENAIEIEIGRRISPLHDWVQRMAGRWGLPDLQIKVCDDGSVHVCTELDSSAATLIEASWKTPNVLHDFDYETGVLVLRMPSCFYLVQTCPATKKPKVLGQWED